MWPYLIICVVLLVAGAAFYWAMRQVNSHGGEMASMIERLNHLDQRLTDLGPTRPFFKHVEDSFSDILHHDDDNSGMDELLDKLKRAPVEPMNEADRTKLKELLTERGNNETIPEKEQKVARAMGDIMDLALDEETDSSPIIGTQMVGMREAKPEEES